MWKLWSLVALLCIGYISVNSILLPSCASPWVFEFFVTVKCPATIHAERLRHTEQSGVVNMPDALFVLQTDKNRGEGSRQMLAALWQPVPQNMPYSIFSTWTEFSAAHTLQQQRGGEAALDSVQLRLFEKIKKGREFCFWRRVPSSTAVWVTAQSSATQRAPWHRETSLHRSTFCWAGPMTPAHSNYYF